MPSSKHKNTKTQNSKYRTSKALKKPKHIISFGLVALAAGFLFLGTYLLPRSDNSSSAAEKCVIDTGNIIGWWRGEQNLKGKFGPDLLGDPQYDKAAVGHGFSFDGNSYLYTDNLPTVSSGVTAQTWVKPVSDNFLSDFIISRWKAVYHDSGNSYGLMLEDNGRLSWWTDETSTRVPVVLSADAPQLFDGNFHHIAGTWDTQAGIKLYIDGQVVATHRAVGGVLNSGQDTQFRIGRISGTGIPFAHTGIVDESAIFNRALTDSEISAIYTSGGEGICNDQEESKDSQSNKSQITAEQKQQQTLATIENIKQEVENGQITLKKDVCEQREQSLRDAISRLANSALSVKSAIDITYDRVQGFYEEEQLALSNYAELQQEVVGAQIKAEGAIGSVESYRFDLDCENPNAGTQLIGYRSAVSTAREALKAYRDSVVQLIVNINNASGSGN